MHLFRLLLATALATWAAAAPAAPTRPQATLPAFDDEAQLQRVLARWSEGAARLQRQRSAPAMEMAQGPTAALSAAPAAPAVAGKAQAADSITNVQTAGVDEGGIVKQAGDYLVVLRRGRLFSVRVGGDQLQPAGMSDAYAPGSDPRGAWYDELLVSGSTVVVIGYSYARGGTEVGLFELAPDGALAYRATYHLRSFDYYSSRNYASRLVDGRLVFYTPTLLRPGQVPAGDWMPAWRRWQPAALPQDFQRLLPATRIHRIDEDLDPAQPLALHTVTRCDIGAASLRCEASAVLGPAGRVFYVAADAVYVWTGSGRGPREGDAAAAVFRLPLDGSAPSGLKAAGMPVDQMSFLDDGSHLNVLLREQGGGESMWGSERTRGALALLRVPLGAFGDGRDAAGREHYRRLPGPASWQMQNRFVGDWLLWGGAGDTAWALRFAGRGDAVALRPGHAVERIEAMGANALLVGNAGADLHLSAVRLAGDGAELAGRYVQAGARQGETRSHGFFYRATGDGGGLLGLPVQDAGASVGFLRETGLSLQPLGRLAAQGGERDDRCRASCVDWYGNARPIFLGGRILALMGYELVEGQLQRGWRGERVEEVRRVSFAPAGTRRGVYSPFE